MRLLLAVFGVAVLVFLLHHAFPYALENEDTRMRVLYFSLLVAVIVAGRRKWNRPLPKVARDAAIWLGILLVLIMGYSLRDDLGHNRLLSELLPSHAQDNKDGTLIIHASEDGHFHIEAIIDGTPMRFLIDTGASDIVLSPQDARRAGFDTAMLDYRHPYATANGMGSGAWITLGTLEIGSIALRKIPASVNKAWMDESLLGMSFLRRLSGFRVEGSKLILIP